MRILLMQSLGYGFLVLGVVGVLLPILQGSLCFLIGLAILSRHVAWAERLMNRLKQRFPRLGQLVEVTEARAAGWWDRLALRARR